MKKHLFAAGAAGLALACATAASAQSIDYGSLEQMFNEPVTTSATGSPQRSTDAPVDMTIISASDIQRSGATDLPTILSRVAGVDVLNWSAGTTDVGIRGYNQAYSPRLLVLVNGRQVYLDHYGYTAWSTIPVQLDEIRQIEVVRGPNSALFGFNAVGGVVNIITYNPKFDDADTLTVRGGSNGYAGGSLVATGKLGEKAWARLSIGSEKQNEWSAGPKTVPADSFRDPTRTSAALDTVFQLAPKTELRVETSWATAEQTDMPPNYSLYGLQYDVWSVKGALTSETGFGLVQAQAYMNQGDTEFTFQGTKYHFDNPIKVVSIQDLFKVGANHTFRVGLEYRDNSMTTTPIEGGEVSYKVLAPSAMWNWAVSPKVALTTAVRLDHMSLKRSGSFPAGFPNRDNRIWDRETDQVSANVGAVFKATEHDTFRLAYARGVQSPTLLELGGVQSAVSLPGLSFAITGNPRLEPTIVTNYEATYDHSIQKLAATVSAKVFVQSSKDLKASSGETVLPAAPGDALGLIYGNVGDSKLKGFELSASSNKAVGFRWAVDYTYTDIEDEAPTGVDPRSLGIAYSETTPKHRGNANVGWANEAWAADLYVHYVDSFYGVAPFGGTPARISKFATLSGRVAYKAGKDLTVAVSGQNLLDDQQTQSTGFRADRRLLLTVSKSW